MTPLNTTTEILTVEEARKRLPEVKALVARIMAAVRTAKEIDAKLNDLKDVAESDLRPSALRARRNTVEGAFRTTLKELNDRGAVLKDAEVGLIDFYTWKGDDVALLCWQYGEETIRYWHGINDGFTGRRLIDEGKS